MVIIREEEKNVGTTKELFNLTPAEDLRVFTKANGMVFKEYALRSKAYRRLLELITESSLEGRYSIEFELHQDEDVHLLSAFKEALESAGYKANYHSEIFGLFVSWE